MSTGAAHLASGALVVATTSGGSDAGYLRAWVHPDTVAGTSGWSKQASPNGALYDRTRNRRVLERDGTSADVNTGLEFSYRTTDSSDSTAVAWGQPVKVATPALRVVFVASSL